MANTGIFIDVAGLTYQSGTTTGATSAEFHYSYEPGEEVVFSIGSLILGKSTGKPVTTILDLVSADTAAFHPTIVNRARLLFSLSSGQGFEKPIVIDQNVEAVVSKYASEIDLDAEKLSDLDEPLRKICSELNLQPKSVPHTRNHLRRLSAGFKVLRDIVIPSPDGGSVLADVYLPLQPNKKFPVLLGCTLYGRRVPWGGPDINDEEDILRFERAEDEWHSTADGSDLSLLGLGPWSEFMTTQRGFENIANFNTFSYVPYGYAMVRIDPKGVSQTPGKRWVPGELAGDFYTAVEWCAEQPWSNGTSALIGSSYGANTQWAVAGLQPKGLKCIVPYGTDIDSYREAAYIGGVPSTRYLENWFARVRGVSTKWEDQIDVEQMMKDNPTYNSIWAMLDSKPDSSANIPCFIAASQIFMIHGRGAYEAWMVRQPENTHLQLVDCNYYSWASREASAKIIQFLNHYLKSEDCAAPEPVGIQMRLGNQDWYWRKEQNWPVPGTQYKKWHLTTAKELTETPPVDTAETRFEYPARSPQQGKSGVSFHSAPFEEDVELAGHFVAVLSVCSTAPDADVAVLLWAVDEVGQVVAYGASSSKPEPVAKGFLRVSHRKTDDAKSLPWRPWHTHTAEDLAPLQGIDDVVQIDVEILPAAARIRKGWTLRVDICPSEEQPDIPGYTGPPMRLWYGDVYEGEATDAIQVGGSRANYILCPVVPKMEGYSKCMV
ncbi:Alpha/Beta hydrolase protein [Dactylonectria macrodidyma]|uniref:Alpha/Beta hydrolase protein n=1 Tax=Dactylonectria macrodidyma TaxID=307937 RepID=A0A9P9EVQ4_9HYPO|nr:Alpha/Beta hydrolase protein [Dactylonectria macrodidyma]